MESPTAYLIYYNDPDCYERTDWPFAIVETEARAKEITQEIIEHGESLANQMLYPHEEDISSDEYFSRENKNKELINGPWPYQWEASLYSDFENDWPSEDKGPTKMRFLKSTVAYKTLPLLK